MCKLALPRYGCSKSKIALEEVKKRLSGVLLFLNPCIRPHFRPSSGKPSASPHRVSNHNGCQGQATYNLEKIDEAVLTVVRRYFRSISSLPTSEMLRAASDRVRSVNDNALEKAEAVLKKAQAEMSALEEEAVKALTGESKMDLYFINYLIPKRRANLEKALAETERIRAEIDK